MIPIYDLKTAKEGILKRTPITDNDYPDAVRNGVEKLFGRGVTPAQAVAQILKSVRLEGDDALCKWSQKLDRVEEADFCVGTTEISAAHEEISDELRIALSFAADRIRHFHELQPIPDWRTAALGGILGQRVTPIGRVGCYVPGGTAPLPSSLLMTVIPAQVAGVRQIIVCTPPNPHPSILAAAHICGLDNVYTLGGAQAIGAMAFGTATVPKVDKIVGAGNLFVTLAKQQVFGIVGLDGLAGPTETMVLADHTANPTMIAADLLAQAEHDILASAILLTPEPELAEDVQSEVSRQVDHLSRAEIISQSLTNRGGIVITTDLDQAIDLANDYAAEHLCLAVENPNMVAKKITNAGGIFLNERSFEVLGDYVAGPSHVMPTGGSARFSSPLNVLDFVKLTSIVALDSVTSRSISEQAVIIAEIETLTAHAAAAQQRLESSNV